MTLRTQCLRPDSGQVRSVVVIDAENLFRGAARKIPSLLRAVDRWTSQRMPPQKVTRTYGFPHAISRNWGAVEAAMERVGVTHVSTTPGKDIADNWMENDLSQVKDLGLAATVGSADYDSLIRCVAGLDGGTTRLEWIILTPRERRPGSHPFAPGGKLSFLPASRAVTIDQVYADFVRARTGPDYRPSPVEGGRRPAPRPLDVLRVDWAGVRVESVSGLTERWQAAVAEHLAETTDLALEEGRSVALTLATWLPTALPDHYHRDLTELSDEAWEWHCWSAIVAAALMPGCPTSAVEVRVLLAFAETRDELGQKVLERAPVVLRRVQQYSQRDLLRLISGDKN